MRAAAFALILFASPAMAGPPRTTAEYLTAYGKARAYAAAHSPLAP